MRTKSILIALILPLSMMAQNLQVHYDFGKDRSYVTTTLEMFKPDKWGNTFFFVDFDYNMGQEKHPSTAYMEIARCLKFWQAPLSIHVEYNGGLGSFPAPLIGQGAFPINNAYLAGVDYSMNNADFTKTLSLKALYKYIQGKQSSAQITAVWGLHFMNRKLSFTGFADLWLEKNNFGGTTTNTVFITEPQLWYNFTEHLSVGTEVEVATNFGGVEGIKVCPTAAVKWNF